MDGHDSRKTQRTAQPSDARARHLSVSRDPRLCDLEWRDLVPLSRHETVHELALSAPWLGLSWVLADAAYYPAAMAASFMMFLTALRQVHNAHHNALGIGRRGTELFLFLMSIVMLGSNHAVKFNHLRHHKFCLGKEDTEAVAAQMSGFRALLFGPYFPVLLIVAALRARNRRLRLWVMAELSANAVWIVSVLVWLEVRFLIYHLAVMAMAQCLTAFFAVWTVHHHCDDHPYPARTQRGGLANWMSYGMFRHAEHHLFPKVPTCHLDILARRIDAVMPELAAKQVMSVKAFGHQ